MIIAPRHFPNDLKEIFDRILTEARRHKVPPKPYSINKVRKELERAMERDSETDSRRLAKFLLHVAPMRYGGPATCRGLRLVTSPDASLTQESETSSRR
ncbi:hypothetical protein HPB47_011761 [Ixodes persulcatus]|uniref:Uncharacterized protein n=1 Tax=Ixodes persulcatus TaxID=34615 RepID=A0AC60NVJ0_IXOPE|nr:hypothetical protein HPB47_011761 [Ixodes persulcatus]